MNPPPGTPWPDGEHGEVVSPTGQRAYLATTAATLAARSTKWASTLAKNNIVDSERGQAGRRGLPAWFLLADSFENYLRSDGKWPPTPAPSPGTDWQQLLALQGADLEAERQANNELRAEITRLTAILEQRDNHIAQLAQMVAQLTTTPR